MAIGEKMHFFAHPACMTQKYPGTAAAIILTEKLYF